MLIAASRIIVDFYRSSYNIDDIGGKFVFNVL